MPILGSFAGGSARGVGGLRTFGVPVTEAGGGGGGAGSVILLLELCFGS
jgi:hypothetical protein